MPIPKPIQAKIHKSQCTIKATIGCGIISPNCEAQFAVLRAKSPKAVINPHIATKKPSKSLTNALERMAVNTVTSTP